MSTELMASHSSILLIGHHSSDSAFLGVETATDLDQARKLLEQRRFSVVSLSLELDSSAKTLQFLNFLREKFPLIKVILIRNSSPLEALKQASNCITPFKILSAYDDPRLSLTLQEALEEYGLAEQNAQLLKIVNQQNERLQQLKLDLEDRVNKRHKYLENTKKRLVSTNSKIETLQKALIAIYQSTHLPEMEAQLLSSIGVSFQLDWIRIVLEGLDQFDQQIQRSQSLFTIFKNPLLYDSTQIGHVYFARKKESPFEESDLEFLGQVTEAVALAVVRLSKIKEAEILKAQWQATFNSVAKPLALINQNYDIDLCNQAFSSRQGKPPKDVMGKKCHEVLFSKSQPCQGCKLGQDFTLSDKNESGVSKTFDVTSQQIDWRPAEEGKIYFHVYHDVTEQRVMEEKILESSKMAELGLIGSSIAHELNNPIGGMLNFVQLIRMGLSGQENYFQDIADMEEGVQRCKEIVENLLGFSRKPSFEDMGTADLKDVIQKAIKITELHTRAKGIEIQLTLPEQKIMIFGHTGLLAQAFRHVLQILSETHASTIQFHIQIERESVAVKIQAVGPSVKAESLSPFALTVARQIFLDHHGSIDLQPFQGQGIQANLSLPLVSGP